MRTLLTTLLAGSALALGACQATDVRTADAFDAGRANHHVVSGGQSRYTVDIPRHDATILHDDRAYSLSGDATPARTYHPDEHRHAVDTSSFYRHATNGGN